MTGLTRLALRRPLWTLLLISAVTVWFGLGATRLTTDAGFRSYLGNDHPSVQRLDAFIDRFGGGLPAAIVWSCEQTSHCDSVFDPASLRMAEAITQRLARTPGVQRVESPATSPVLVPSPDGLAVRRLVDQGQVAPDREELARWALIDPAWHRRLVSADGTVGAIFVQLTSSDSDTNSRVVGAMRQQVARFEIQGFRFHLVGDPVVFVIAAEDLERDGARLVPAILALIFLVVLVLFRSPKAALMCLGTVGVAMIWTFGTAGWMGWSQTAVSQALGPFVLVIGVCDAIHFLSRLATKQQHTSQERNIILRTAKDVAPACSFTTATTAGGFLSFSGAGIESFAHFGILAATGVIYALVLTFSLLPAMLPYMGTRRLATGWDWLTPALRSATTAISRRPRTLAIAFIILTLAASRGLEELSLDGDFQTMFGDESRVVRWMRFVESRLGNLGALEVEIRSSQDSLRSSKSMQQIVANTQAFLGSVEGIESAHSILDLTAHARRIVNDSNAANATVEDKDISEAEVIFLISLADASLLDPWMSLDGRRIRLSAAAREESASSSETILGTVERFLKANLPAGYAHTLTGSFSLQYHLFNEVQALQLRSFAIAWAVVFVLLGVFLRSVRLALLGMVPTTAPVVVTLGVMGFWGINLDVGTAMVGAVVLGIAVDDTIHLLFEYRERRRTGDAPAEAIRYAVLRVGHAVVTTSVALALGFFTMTVSSWQSVASFGLLAGIAILGALVADLVLLPALVMGWADRHRGSREPTDGGAGPLAA